MSDPGLVEERIVLRFLERYVADRDAEGVRPLADYQALFPGHGERLREEYEALQRGGESLDRLGPYRLLRPLGRGGQGVVYLARDDRFGRTVALKVLPRALGAGGLPARLAREMEVLSRLDHPGICVVYEAGEIDGHAYLAMRHVPGVSLAEHVADLRAGREARGASWSDSSSSRRRVLDAVELVEHIARALHEAHEAGVVHRDVKPANVIVHESGRPVLLDFGLARAESSAIPTLTRTGDFVGTAHYMSPERLRGEGLTDRRTDVWSLGVTLYELLTGVRPFEGPTLEAVARRVAHDEPEGLRTYDRAIPRDLANVVAKAMEKSPARRYATAAAFADDLERVRRGVPVRARPISAPERAARWTRRNPAAAVALAALAVGLVSTAAVARTLRRLADERADALRSANAHLAKSVLEEARLLALSDEHGRSWRILERVESAGAARLAAGSAPGAPMPLDLRNLAVEALLMADARPLATHAHPQSTAAAFSESGRLMVTRSLRAGATRIFTSAIRLLDAASGEVLATCADPRILDAEEGLAVAADGSVAVPGPGELEIDVWDLRAGRVLRSFALPEELVLNERTESQRRLWKLRFSPDGRYLAAACVPHEGFGVTPTKRGWAVWETATGRKLVSVTGGEHLYAWLSFSPDSRELAAPLDVEAIGVAELGDNAHLRWRVDCDQPVRRAALSGGDDPRVFAILGRDDAREDMLVVVRDGGERLHSAGLGCRVAASTEADLAYDPGRELLLFADTDRGLRLVGAGDGLARVTVNVAHEHGIGALTFAGDRILSHGRLGVTRVWEPVADRGLMQAFPMPVRPFGEGERPRARGDYLVLSSDGARAAMIAMHDSASVWGWDVASLDTTWTRLTWPVEDRTVLMIALHATADGAVQVARTCREGVTAWDAAGAGVDVVPSEGGWFDGGAFLDDGTYQCSELGDGGYVRVRLPPGGRAAAMRTALPLPADARFVRLARDDRWAVAAVGEDAEPEQRLFDLAAGTDVPLELGPRPVTSVRADRFVAGDTLVGALVLRDRERLSLCRVPDGSRVCEVPYDAAAGVVAWDVTPDGRTVVVPGADGEVRLHAAADGAELVRWRAAQHPVVFVAALDGGRIATWSGVGSLRVWELERMRSELAARGLAW